jgi:hypothetical protein
MWTDEKSKFLSPEIFVANSEHGGSHARSEENMVDPNKSLEPTRAFGAVG